MPAKAIPFIAVAVLATGIFIYQNREQIIDLYERGREKLARQLHKMADSVGPRQREAPLGYSDRRRESFEERFSREEEVESFLHAPISTGRASAPPSTGEFRHRNPTRSYLEQESNHVLYDFASDSKDIPMERLSRPRDSITYEKELPPPPLPPRRQQTPPPPSELAPSESGYGSERTAVVISPPIRPQPSPLSRVQEQSEKSPTPAAIPIAAAVVTGATSGTAVALAAPDIMATFPSSPSTLSSRPESIHSSSGSEPDVLPPNPFEASAHYISIQEWANNASSGDSTPSTPTAPSEIGSVAGEVVDIPDVVSDFGSNSDGDFEDAASWTEVGSETSENDY
ncbi:hypothetical protein BDZ91DRAFT_369325 [Kalaharituber pfeilii]|nr:hypothetical protein BDZ91DRAFT_369325 [Kalaharituber pfeilii]